MINRIDKTEIRPLVALALFLPLVGCASAPQPRLDNSPPTPTLGPRALGRLPPEVIQRAVRVNFTVFRLCFEAGMRRDPNLTGKVVVRFVIGLDGAVTSVTDGGSDLPDQQVVACVVRSFSRVQFPPPNGGTVTVTYPIMFNTGGPPPDIGVPLGAQAPSGGGP